MTTFLRMAAVATLGDPGAANYAWTIDKDVLTASIGGDDESGTTGPSNAPQTLLDRLAAGEGTRFRMLDDDGELYYEGRILIDDEQDEEAFGPLNDFGMPNAGCTEIQYKRDRKWTAL